jgi:hypothetical protein
LSPGFVEWMQGAPTNWTEGAPRGARLRMLGNGVFVPAGRLVASSLPALEPVA